MISINKVRKIEVKRVRIKGNAKKGIAPFHAITLTVSHSPSNLANKWLEKIQISLMSETELPILELSVDETAKKAKAEEEFNENEEAGMRTLTDPEAWAGGIADNE